MPRVNQFLKWCSFSPAGHVVLFELAIAAPIFLVFSILIGLAGRMSSGLALGMAAVLALGGAVVGLLTWFTVTRPLIRKRP